jgi:hypothetical protein
MKISAGSTLFLLWISVFVLGLCSSPTNQALAQNATGAINGTITDPNDAVVGGAAVSATHRATGASRKLTANSEGFFVIESLIPGEYEVKIEAPGFTAQVGRIRLLKLWAAVRRF